MYKYQENIINRFYRCSALYSYVDFGYFFVIILVTIPPGLCGNVCTLGGFLFLWGNIFMGERVFKTLDQQIDILTGRGLIINDSDRESAKDFFLKNNYYRISGYSLTLRNHDEFYENASFQNIKDIYNFDHEFRHILLEHLEVVEVQIKSIFAYEFSKQYGGTGYLNSDNFTNVSEYLRIINKANEQKDKNISDEAYIQHYVNDLQESMPIWAYVDLLSFSDISVLYSISKPDLQNIIADYFGLKNTNKSDILKEYLRGLTILRNFCAHGRRLYNRLFVRKPTLNSKEKKLLSKDEKGIVDNSHLFGFILELKRILPSDDYNKLKTSIIDLSKKYPFVHMKYYGFCDDWVNLI